MSSSSSSSRIRPPPGTTWKWKYPVPDSLVSWRLFDEKTAELVFRMPRNQSDAHSSKKDQVYHIPKWSWKEAVRKSREAKDGRPREVWFQSTRQPDVVNILGSTWDGYKLYIDADDQLDGEGVLIIPLPKAWPTQTFRKVFDADEHEYEVDSIAGERQIETVKREANADAIEEEEQQQQVSTTTWYLVQWTSVGAGRLKDHGPAFVHATWQTADDLENCIEALQTYEKLKNSVPWKWQQFDAKTDEWVDFSHANDSAALEREFRECMRTNQLETRVPLYYSNGRSISRRVDFEIMYIMGYDNDRADAKLTPQIALRRVPVI